MLKREGLWISCPSCGASDAELAKRGKVIAYPVRDLDALLFTDARASVVGEIERARELARPYFSEVGAAGAETPRWRRLLRWVWRHTRGRGYGQPSPLDSFARGLG